MIESVANVLGKAWGKAFDKTLGFIKHFTQPPISAAGDAKAMEIRKAAYTKSGMLDDRTAGRLAMLESMRPDVAKAVIDRIDESFLAGINGTFRHAESETSSSEDFDERFKERISEPDSVFPHILRAAGSATQEELKELLGKILAKDVDEPGTIAPSAVDIAKKLSKSDLCAFRELRRIAWSNDNTTHSSRPFLALPEVLDHYGSLGTFTGLTYDNIMRLVELGLIRESVGESKPLHLGRVDYNHKGEVVRCQTYAARNGDQCLILGVVKEWELPLGRVSLTTDGESILQLYMDEPFDGTTAYFTLMRDYWQKKGFLTEVKV